MLKKAVGVLLLISISFPVLAVPLAAQNTKASASFANPVWSPDGNVLAYLVRENDQTDVWIQTIPNGNAMNLTYFIDGDKGQTSWDPNSKRLAFVASYQGNYDVWVIDIDGSDAVNLSESVEEPCFGPEWSPRSSRLVFLSQSSEDSFGRNIWLINIDSRELINTTEYFEYANEDARWFSDGSTLAFATNHFSVLDDFSIVVTSGGLSLYSLIDNTTHYLNADCCFGVLDPEWSPDGKKIAFITQTTNNINESRAVALVSIESGQFEIVPDFIGFHTDIMWSPDGQSLLSVAGDDLYQIDTQNFEVNSLTEAIDGGVTQVKLVNDSRVVFALRYEDPDLFLAEYSYRYDIASIKIDGSGFEFWVKDITDDTFSYDISSSGMIAYTTKSQGQRYIWLFDTETDSLRQLDR